MHSLATAFKHPESIPESDDIRDLVSWNARLLDVLPLQLGSANQHGRSN